MQYSTSAFSVGSMAILCFRQKRPKLSCNLSFLGWQKHAIWTTLAFLDALHPVLYKVHILHAALMVFPTFFHRGECRVMHTCFSTHHSISGPLWGLGIPAFSGEPGAHSCWRNTAWRIISAEPGLTHYLSYNRAHLSQLAIAGRRGLWKGRLPNSE